MSTPIFYRLDVESLDVESFEPRESSAGVLLLDSDPDPDTGRVDSRAAGCTEPLRVCSGQSADLCATIDLLCTAECGPPSF